MSDNIMQSDDSYNEAYKARFDADSLRKQFSAFADHLGAFETDEFAFGDLQIKVARSSDYFDLKSSAQTIRFYLVIRKVKSELSALVRVFKLPTHADLERPIEVGAFTMDKHGQTSLQSQSYPVRLYGLRESSMVALHFFAQALTRENPSVVPE